MVRITGALISVFMLQLLSNSCVSVLAPFFPRQASEKGLSETMIGLVFSGYPISAVVLSPFLGGALSRFGRKKIYLIGGFVCAVSCLLFGFTIWLDKISFQIGSFFLRLFQGTGGCIIATASIAIIVSTYPDDMDILLGIHYSLAAVGMLVGPLLGGGLYSLGGFTFLFCVYAAIFFVFLPYAYITIPKDKPYVKPEVEFSIIQLFKNPGVMLVAFQILIAFLVVSFIEPVLSLHLDSYGLGVIVIAICFTLPTVTYAFSSVVIKPLTNVLSRPTLLSIGLLVTGVSMIFMGPWLIPRHIAWVVAALLVLGIGLCFQIVPGVPQMVAIAQIAMPQYDQEHVSDAVSSVSMFGIYLGEIIGPFLAGILTEHLGFQNASAVSGGICLVYMPMFLMLVKLYRGRIEKKKVDPLMQELVITNDIDLEQYLEVGEETKKVVVMV